VVYFEEHVSKIKHDGGEHEFSGGIRRWGREAEGGTEREMTSGRFPKDLPTPTRPVLFGTLAATSTSNNSH
jgi:hypothetical protein